VSGDGMGTGVSVSIVAARIVQPYTGRDSRKRHVGYRVTGNLSRPENDRHPERSERVPALFGSVAGVWRPQRDFALRATASPGDAQ